MRNLERPPLGAWLRYRLFGSRVPGRYLAWAEQDIRSQFWPWLSSGAIPIGVVTATLIARLLTDEAKLSTLVWYAVAVVVGFGLSVVAQGWSRWRGMTDRRRGLALRYQRGEITKAEWNRLQHGEFSWTVLSLALTCGLMVFVGLYFLDRQ